MAQNITEIIRAIAEQSMPHIVIGYIQTVEPLEVILIDDINISLSDQSVICLLYTSPSPRDRG